MVNDQPLKLHLTDPTQLVTKLREINIFRHFSDHELSRLQELGETRFVQPTAHIVIEGEPSKGVYIIIQGSASVYKTDQISGTLHRIAYLEANSHFGEISLFDNAPRSATVSADTKCTLFCLDGRRFERFLDDIGDEAKARFYKGCAEVMSERFRTLNADYINAQQLLWKYALRRADP